MFRDDILRERLKEEFIRLVEIDSPSYNEEKIFSYLKERLNDKRLELIEQTYEVQGYNCKNLIVKVRGNSKVKKSIFFDTHVDTVESNKNVKVVVENGTFKTDGQTILGADDKSAVASLILIIEYLLNNKIEHGDLYFIFTSAEETRLAGAKNLDISQIKADFGLVLDASGDVGNIIIGAPTHYDYKILVKGRASHAGIEPEKGINAIKIAGKIIEKLPQGRINKWTVSNIGKISGGKAVNIVADECLINGEFRSHKLDDINRIKERIQKICKEFKKEAIDININFSEEYKSYRFKRNNSVIKLIGKAMVNIGIKPNFIFTGGGSNANVYNNKNILSIVLSTGMKKVHSKDEYVEIFNMVNLTKLLIEIIKLA